MLAMASAASTGLGIAFDPRLTRPGGEPPASHPHEQLSVSSRRDALGSGGSTAGALPAMHSVTVVYKSAPGVLDSANEKATEEAHANDSRSTISSTVSSRKLEAGLPGSFVRSDTLLSFGQSQTRNAAELQALMGNSNARLKAGATVHAASSKRDTHGAEDTDADAVALEQAKSRSRVEVDIVLESDTFVQGGFMKGHVKIRVRKRSRKEQTVCLADPKVRVVGFESIPGESERHTFYQCASPLSTITDNLDRLYDTPADDDGFARAIEGVHTLPFAMRLPMDSKFGAAKGALSLHSGVIVQYIAMV